MDNSQLANVLLNSVGSNVYVRFEPEILDFTDQSVVPEMQVFSQSGVVKILLTDEVLPILLPMLRLSIFGKDRKILTWNWKNFVSFILGKTKKLFQSMVQLLI